PGTYREQSITKFSGVPVGGKMPMVMDFSSSLFSAISGSLPDIAGMRKASAFFLNRPGQISRKEQL
ncbi:MAG: hypothetical protein KJ727_00730, partial [Acidobacteria bacterium]|nr:hypothetical protein [Acidobacteriota bacterium]